MHKGLAPAYCTQVQLHNNFCGAIIKMLRRKPNTSGTPLLAVSEQKKGRIVSVIQCCGRNQKTHAFICDAPEGFVFQQIDFLVYCKVCKTTVMQVTRVDSDGQVSYFRRTNADARRLFERMRPSIQFKVPPLFSPVSQKSSFWLPYNEFGTVKRCYSNLSALKPVGESLMLPKMPLKI